MGRKVDFESEEYLKIIKKRLIEKIKIDENDCWLWFGCTNEKYGLIRYKKKNYFVHRLSFELFKNEKAGDKNVCHKCDKPLCINPDHLFLGTHADNMKDATNKRRYAFGEKHYQKKLKEKDVDEIIKLHKCGIEQQEIARLFNLCQPAISKIIKGENWKYHIKDKYNIEIIMECIILLHGELQLYKILNLHDKLKEI